MKFKTADCGDSLPVAPPTIRQGPSPEVADVRSLGLAIISATPDLSPSSKAVLGYVWQKVCAEFATLGLEPAAAPATAWLDLSFKFVPPGKHGARRKEHARRMLLLAEKVCAALVACQTPSPLQPGLALRMLGDERLVNDRTVFLADDQQAALVRFLAAEERGAPLARRRDKAFAALCLCAGAKSSQAHLLTVSALDTGLETGLLTLPKLAPDGEVVGRIVAPLLPGGQAPLRLFLEALKDVGEVELPFGIGIDRRGVRPLPAVTHSLWFRRTKALLVEACPALCPADRRLGPQTLRNTYAAHHFKNGAPPAQIMRWMGFASIEPVYRLRAAWNMHGQRGCSV